MSNLRDRLRRIQEQKSSEPIHITISNEQKTESGEQRTKNIEQLTKNKVHKKENINFDLSILKFHGWNNCGYNVLKREVCVKSPFKPNKTLPCALSVLIPDLRTIEIPSLESFIFFDLETTGLSSGSGTIAFLAAFGQNISTTFRITQYLLLDFNGQIDFLENVLSQFSNKKSVIVTYNGKSFDSQILKTMCIMNRIKPPEYFHADLLHPGRRLWKTIIQNCSQSSIETKILALDRTGDISGEFAPDIWFEFIKTGRIERLNQICDHNKADISGLASIFSAMIDIANTPINKKYKYDIERLALYWRKYSRGLSNNSENEIIKKGDKLLKYAAENKYPKAVYIYGYDQMKKNNLNEALKYADYGLEIYEKKSIWHEKLLRRKEKLIRKISHLNNNG